MSARNAVLAAFLLLLPASASAQPAVTSGARIGLFFQGAALGKLHLTNATEDPGKFDFSFGFLARIDTPVNRYLVAGGEAGFLRFRTAQPSSVTGRDTYADLGSTWKLRYPIPLKSGKYLEPFLMVPLGITFFAPSTQWTNIAGGAGFYTGGFLGLSYFLGPRTVLNGEIGWQHRFTWQEYHDPNNHRSFANGGQLTFRVGIAIRL